MASTSRKKLLCSKCDKAGILSCYGCKRDFCYLHVTKHRQDLNKKMEEIITKRDQLQQTITEQKAQPNCHPLMEQIDEWEQQSIIKIRQTAHEIRLKVLDVLDIHRTNVIDTLFHFTQELNKARNDDDYVETDLKEWSNKLKQLRKDLIAAQTIRYGQDDNDNTLISKIFVDDVADECFAQMTGDIQVLVDGRVIEHGQTNKIAMVRGRGEYSSGQHPFHFKMEQLCTNHGFHIGIVSKNTSNESILRAMSTNGILNKSSCVLATSSFRRQNGDGFLYFNRIDFNIRSNDILELLIDCDRRTIRLKHEQLQNQQEITVDVNRCSSPWQFFVCLSNPGDRVLLY